MEAVVTVALGPLKVNFHGQGEAQRSRSAKLLPHFRQGNGGFAGSATGGADVKLEIGAGRHEAHL